MLPARGPLIAIIGSKTRSSQRTGNHVRQQRGRQNDRPPDGKHPPLNIRGNFLLPDHLVGAGKDGHAQGRKETTHDDETHGSAQPDQRREQPQQDHENDHYPEAALGSSPDAHEQPSRQEAAGAQRHRHAQLGRRTERQDERREEHNGHLGCEARKGKQQHQGCQAGSRHDVLPAISQSPAASSRYRLAPQPLPPPGECGQRAGRRWRRGTM